MAEREVYRLNINVDLDGDEKAKKKLSAVEKYAEKSEKRMNQLDKVQASPAVRLEDKLTGPMGKIEKSIGGFAKRAVGKFAAIATAGAVLVGGLGIKSTMSTFVDFEQGLANVQAVSKASSDEMKRLSDTARQLGRDTEWSAVEVTEAQTLLAQAGFTVQQNIDALPGLLSLASAGELELADATTIVAGTLNSFGMEAKEAGTVADVLALASNKTSSDVEELGDALKYVGPVAKGLNIGLEDTTAVLGMLHDANIKGGQAGTVLRGSLVKLAKPSKEASELMNELGFSAFDSNGQMLGLEEIIGGLQKSTAGLTEEQRANAMATLFGQQNMAGMLAIVEQGPEKFKELSEALKESSGASDEIAKLRLNSISGQMDLLKSATDDLKISLGEKLAPYTRDFVEWLTEKMPSLTDKVVAVASSIEQSFKKFKPQFKQIIEGVKKVMPVFSEMGKIIFEKMQLLASKLQPLVQKAINGFISHLPTIKKAISSMSDVFIKVLSGIQPAAKKIIEILQKMSPVIVGIAASLATLKFASIVGKGIDKFKEFSIVLSNTKAAFSLASGGVGGLKAAMGALMGPVGWIAIAIGAVVTAGVLLYKNWDTVKEKAGQLGQWISDKWNGIKEATSEAWNNVKESVAEKWSATKEAVLSIGPAIKDGVVNTWDKVKTGTINKWNSIKNGISNKVSEIKGAIEDKFLSLPDSILEPLNTMKEAISTVFDGVINIFQGAWEVIKNIFMGALLIIIDIVTLDFEQLALDISMIWENIKEGFSLIWEGITEIFTGALEYIQGLAELVWNSIKEVIVLVWNSVTEFLVQTWENIKEGAIAGWNSFKEGVSSIITGITTWIKDTWNETVEWFSTLPSRLMEKGIEMFTALGEGLSSMLETVVSKAKEVGTGILDAVKELPGKMLSIGGDIMRGLANGIKNTIMAPINAAKNAASRVGNAIRDKLQINSPSKLMIEYGGFTTEGLALGMEKEMPKLEKASSGNVDIIEENQVKQYSERKSPLEKVVEKVSGYNPMNVFNDNKESQPQFALATAGGGGGTTTIINIDGTNIEISEKDENGEDKTDKEIVEEAMTEFGKAILDALQGRK